MKTAALAILAALWLAASPAFGGSANENLAVSARILDVCTIATSAVSFGDYDPFVKNASAPLNATGAVTLTCTKGAVTTVGLGPGANSVGSVRRMKDGGSALLTYELYQPSSTAPGAGCLYGSRSVWGNSGGTLFTPGPAADRNPSTYSICGQVGGGQSLPPGGYADTVVVSVNF